MPLKSLFAKSCIEITRKLDTDNPFQRPIKPSDSSLERAFLLDNLGYENIAVYYYPVALEGQEKSRELDFSNGMFPPTLIIRVTQFENKNTLTEVVEPRLEFGVHWDFLGYLKDHGIDWKPAKDSLVKLDVSSLVSSRQFPNETVALEMLKLLWQKWTRGGKERLLKHIQNNVDHTVGDYPVNFKSIQEPMRQMGKPTYAYSAYSTCWKKQAAGKPFQMVASIRLMTSGRDHRYLFDSNIPNPSKVTGLHWQLGSLEVAHNLLPVDRLLDIDLELPIAQYMDSGHKVIRVHGEKLEPGNVWAKEGEDRRFLVEAWKHMVRTLFDADQSRDYNLNGKILYIWGDEKTRTRYEKYGFKLVQTGLVLKADREQIEAQILDEKKRRIRDGQHPTSRELDDLRKSLYLAAKKWLVISAQPADLMRMVEYFEKRRDIRAEDVEDLRVILEAAIR